MALLVDGDAPSRKLERIVLESTGWIVTQADDADRALAMLALVRPHVIVLDLRPPREAAYDAIRSIKRAAGSVPIVAVTAMNGSSTERDVRAAGCALFLRKPIDTASFSAQLRALLGDMS